MIPEETLVAFLESKAIDRVADYAKRGRGFRSLNTHDLTTRWVAAFKVWATNPADRDRTEREDLEAELQLRGLEPPLDQVEEEFDAVTAVAVAAEVDMAENNPRRSLELNVELLRDLVEFVRKTENTN